MNAESDAPKLRPASPGERAAIDRMTYAEWGARLTEAQFLERERFLRDLPWTRSHFRTWVWATGGDGDPLVLSSCESFEMRSAFNGALGRTYGIASVFTEPRLRGYRHASRMLEALAFELKQTNELESHALILYSEVGEAIYRRLGFVSRPSYERVFPTHGPASGPTPTASDGGPEFFQLERAPLLREIETPAPVAGYRILPRSEQYAWHFAREDFYAQALGQPRSPVAGGRSGESWIAWAADWKSNSLRVLHLASGAAGETRALIRAAQRHAGLLGLAWVKAHEEEALPQAFWDQLGIEGERRPREDSLAMILPLAPGLSPESWKIISRSMWI